MFPTVIGHIIFLAFYKVNIDLNLIFRMLYLTRYFFSYLYFLNKQHTICITTTNLNPTKSKIMSIAQYGLVKSIIRGEAMLTGVFEM